ncbi:PE-PGRS family protein [Amycolatopsis magusensis]|uniref:PE-PGRS family protein n=1 Tax=Amycolatopsis magusensis TaxID=882444 RepID=UPI0024A9ACA7|nr:PE-PGRS family protein [Amycolatopsis magusensis]MDI5982401.1 PE-PGRS family protein [Amycolatopsis magusensis]
MPDHSVPVSTRRYEAYSHQALKDEVDAGNDPGEAGAIGGQWDELAGRFHESAQALTALLEHSREHWSGEGGEALRGVLTQAARWSGEVAGVSTSVGGSVAAQAEIAARAKAEMPEPVEYDPAGMIRSAAASGNLLALAGLPAAMEETKAAAEAARQKAIDVLNARDAALRDAIPEQSFAPPPPLTTRA